MSDDSTQIVFHQKTYDGLKKNLLDVIKKIENYESRRELPTEPDRREERVNKYKRELIGSYNVFIKYCMTVNNSLDLDSQCRIAEFINKQKEKIRETLLILSLQAELPGEIFGLIDIGSVSAKQIVTDDSGTSNLKTNSATSIENLTDSLGGNNFIDANDDLDSQTSNLNTSPSQTPLLNTASESVAGDSETINSGNRDSIENLNSLNLNEHSQIIIETTPSINNIATMALKPGDILNGIPEFESKSQTDVNKFIANVDLMYTLAPEAGATILAVVKAKLVTANKLGSLDNKTWDQIKTEVNKKYKLTMPFEVAQEKLISIKQGPKETLDVYANRVKSLLDALNNATTNANADIQSSNRSMNENLAIRKFKQNICDKEIRIMALSAEHSSLVEAIAHASAKSEQLNASNVQQQPQPEKRESSGNVVNKNSSGVGNANSNAGQQNKQSNFKYNKNKQEYNKSKSDAPQCVHCKKYNHQSDQCLFRPGGPGLNKSNNGEQSQMKNSNTATVAQPMPQQETEATTSFVPPHQSSQQSQPTILQPYHFLG